MRLEQSCWTVDRGWQPAEPGSLAQAQWVLVFGSRSALAQAELLDRLRAAYPQALVMGCSTAGEIVQEQVLEATLSVVAVEFELSQIHHAQVAIAQPEDSRNAGQALARSLPPEGLKHVFVLSEGLQVNGSALVRGLTETLPDGVAVTGGLSGDGSDFAETWVLYNGQLKPGIALA
ncbi:MAG TPA: FIST N-terminal domain-containing protein, partial [Coleofasciculaceae cyanobacterium]